MYGAEHFNGRVLNSSALSGGLWCNGNFWHFCTTISYYRLAYTVLPIYLQLANIDQADLSVKLLTARLVITLYVGVLACFLA